MEHPERKSLRLKNYDYSTPGAYFITICTKDRRCVLSEIETGRTDLVGALHEAPALHPVLSREGECVRRVLEDIPGRFQEVRLERYVIMPNHIHLLLTIGEARAIHESPLRQAGKRSLLGKVVGYIKMNSSREIHAIRPGEDVWQRSYYDHVIRNEEDLRQIAEYIDTNPARWAEDRFHP